MNQGFAIAFAAVVPAVLATGICKSLCTIQLPDGVLIDAGQPSGNYIPIAGLINLAVLSAPVSEMRIQASEVQNLSEIQDFAPRHVWLAGYYPQIQGFVEQGAQAVIDGVTLDLEGSEADSQFCTTRIAVKRSGL